VGAVGEVPLERLWHAVPSFPTVSEVWLRLLDTAPPFDPFDARFNTRRITTRHMIKIKR